MSYGVILKNAANNQSVDQNSLVFHTTQRSGIGTSDEYYLSVINFTTDRSSIYYNQLATLISPTQNAVNFDANSLGFYGVFLNTKTTSVIKICDIDACETGIGATIYTSSYDPSTSKEIKNYSSPNYIYNGIGTDYFSGVLGYLTNTSDDEIFAYVKFENTDGIKIFSPLVNSGTTTWIEIPDEQFYFNIDYYLEINNGEFDGTSVDYSLFKNITPQNNASILINNKADDQLSGVYNVVNITNKVNLKRGQFVFNYPGQTFKSSIDLRSSSVTEYYISHFYVSSDYGAAAKAFTKDLNLKEWLGTSINDTSKYIPLYVDANHQSEGIINLNTLGRLTKQSDSFKLGVAVSNWFPDSTLLGLGFNCEIKEGSG